MIYGKKKNDKIMESISKNKSNKKYYKKKVM